MKKVLNRCMAALSLVLAFTCALPVRASYYDVDRNVTYKVNEDGTLSVDKTNSVTYRNKVTGDTYVEDGRGKTVSGDYRKAKYYSYNDSDFAPLIYADVDNDLDYDISLYAGETLVGVTVTSGKKNIILTKCAESVYESSCYYDSKNKQYYLKKRDGSIDYVGPKDQAFKKYSYGYRIFGKKAGKANIQIQIADRAGVVTTYNTKVVVSNDTRDIKSITYAGKEIVQDLSKNGKNKKMLECQTSNKEGVKYTTKKSGKLKVKMGSRCKFVTAYVIKPNPYTTKTSTDDYGYGSKTYSRITRGYSRGIDLNGDGDFEDTIDGIDEREYSGYNCKKMGNNQRVTLNKIAEQEKTSSTTVYKSSGEVRKSSSYYKSNMADTKFIIVYQDKLTKEFYNYSFTITLRVGKK